MTIRQALGVRESARYWKGWKNRSGFDQESLEKELRHNMILEDQVCLGSVKMIEVAKSEK